MENKMINKLKIETINFLIENTCASISMRTQEEINNNKLSKNDRQKYIKKILGSEKVNLVLGWQLDDGYFGTRLHTPPSKSKIWSHEGCVRYLLEMGFSYDFPQLKKSLNVMLSNNWQKEYVGSKAGQILGCDIIRASLFSQAGLHDYDFVEEYVKIALISFENVANAKDYKDIAVPYKNKHIFLNGKKLPIVYDFWILAYTFNWRNKSNLDMLKKAYDNLYKWLPLPPTYIKAGNQLIAPYGHIQLPLNNDFEEKFGFPWFNFYELSARIGILTFKSPFYRHFRNLFEKTLKTKGEIFNSLDKKGYVSWSSYSGLALEDNWTKKQNKINDLLFRCCLIDSIIGLQNKK